MNATEFLEKIPYQLIETDREKIHLWRLGRFNNGSVWELVGFKPGYYPPHIHDNTTSEFRFITGSGILIKNKSEIKFKPGDYIRIEKGEPWF